MPEEELEERLEKRLKKQLESQLQDQFEYQPENLSALQFGRIPAGRRLPRDFFTRDGITVAKELLGKVLVHETSVGTVRGVITEAESYMGIEDKGSHSYGGRRTSRTEPMFHRGGTSYVYLIYGMYQCMNIVTALPDVPEAVLLRSVAAADEESRRRMELLRRKKLEESRRKKPEETRKKRLEEKGNIPASIRAHLSDGPGRLCIAMEIKKEDNDVDLVNSPFFYVTEGIRILPGQIHEGKRIGIDYAGEAADYLWRFYL